MRKIISPIQQIFVQKLDEALNTIAPVQSQPTSIPAVTTPQKTEKPQRCIDVKRLKPYFNSTFNGMGNGNISHFDSMIEDLKTKRSAKEFAQIAFMCFDGRQMSSRKANTFENWYAIFCECVGCEKKTYQPKDLRDPKDTLKKLFSYLQ
jgi:hypothetical protein